MRGSIIVALFYCIGDHLYVYIMDCNKYFNGLQLGRYYRTPPVTILYSSRFVHIQTSNHAVCMYVI